MIYILNFSGSSFKIHGDSFLKEASNLFILENLKSVAIALQQWLQRPSDLAPYNFTTTNS